MRRKPGRRSAVASHGKTASAVTPRVRPSASSGHAGRHPTLRKLVNERVAAELLGLSVRTMQKWRLQGVGPRFLKLGHAVRYDLTDLEEFVGERRCESTSRNTAAATAMSAGCSTVTRPRESV
jgi:hypothetical protein